MKSTADKFATFQAVFGLKGSPPKFRSQNLSQSVLHRGKVVITETMLEILNAEDSNNKDARPIWDNIISFTLPG